MLSLSSFAFKSENFRHCIEGAVTTPKPSLVHLRRSFKVGSEVQADPGLKAPQFQSLIVKKDNAAFNQRITVLSTKG